MTSGTNRPGAASDGVAAKPLLRGVIHQYSFFVWVVVAGPVLLVAADPRVRVHVAVYVVCLGAMFGVSALYHRHHWEPAMRMRLRRLDHSAIFLAIAGTYTAVAGVALPADDARWIVGLVWAGTVIGVVFSTVNVWPGAPKVVTALPYVAVGWVAVAALPGLLDGLGPGGFGLLVAGGALYTVGAVVYAARRPNPSPTVFGYHEVFHALVTSAAACHLAVVASNIR